MALLLGFFCASAAATTAGQAAVWDMSVAAVLVALCEFISVVKYRRRDRRPPAPEAQPLTPPALPPNGGITSINNGAIAPEPRPGGPWITALNLLKIGLIYGLFLEGFKLGS